MKNLITKMEYLQIESEGLTSICQAITDAMLYSPNQAEGYTKGLDLFAQLLDEHTEKINKAICEATDEGRVANE